MDNVVFNFDRSEPEYVPDVEFRHELEQSCRSRHGRPRRTFGDEGIVHAAWEPRPSYGRHTGIAYLRVLELLADSRREHIQFLRDVPGKKCRDGMTCWDSFMRAVDDAGLRIAYEALLENRRRLRAYCFDLVKTAAELDEIEFDRTVAAGRVVAFPPVARSPYAASVLVRMYGYDKVA
jgi:hypothetical protein